MDLHASFVQQHFTLVAVVFELSLGVLAWLVGWLVGWSPLAQVAGGSHATLLRDCVVGLVAALPLFAGIVLADRHPVGILRDLRRTVRDEVVPLFRRTSIGGLAAISLAAGAGEELLFRGLIQAGVCDWIGPPWGVWVALLLASLLFGVCHWLCTAYALIATMMGLALGLLLLATGHLAAPMITHAAYDFLALLYVVRWTASPDDSI